MLQKGKPNRGYKKQSLHYISMILFYVYDATSYVKSLISFSKLEIPLSRKVTSFLSQV